MGTLSRYRHGSVVMFKDVTSPKIDETGDVSQPGGSVITGRSFRKGKDKFVWLRGFKQPFNVKKLEVLEVGR